MVIKLDGHRLREAITQRFGGSVGALLDAWSAQNRPNVPEQTAIYRWMGGMLPKTCQRYLDLCGILDLDPVCLIQMPDGNERDVISQIHKAFWRSPNWPLHPSLKFLKDFYGHHFEWPPDYISEIFRTSWKAFEFYHNAEKRKNYFKNLVLRGAGEKERFGYAQVFHFAYKQKGVFSEYFVQFGFIEQFGSVVKLVNINGDVQKVNTCESRQFTAEVWFGPSPSDFKIASLHPFSVTPSHESHAENVVRFTA